MTNKTIVVGRDFSQTPIGRYKADSKWSGEAFREKLLMPAIEGNDEVVVDLSGVAGYGSSFLEEAFGGLVRSIKDRHTQDWLASKMKVIASDQNFQPYVICVEQYIKDAWRHL